MISAWRWERINCESWPPSLDEQRWELKSLESLDLLFNNLGEKDFERLLDLPPLKKLSLDSNNWDVAEKSGLDALLENLRVETLVLMKSFDYVEAEAPVFSSSLAKAKKVHFTSLEAFSLTQDAYINLVNRLNLTGLKLIDFEGVDPLKTDPSAQLRDFNFPFKNHEELKHFAQLPNFVFSVLSFPKDEMFFEAMLNLSGDTLKLKIEDIFYIEWAKKIVSGRQFSDYQFWYDINSADSNEPIFSYSDSPSSTDKKSVTLANHEKNMPNLKQKFEGSAVKFCFKSFISPSRICD